ncbi:hypothetical protein FRC00_000741 [Tulasnella sp. 408]|nr:hypothetical protein FRC00_000741 [Tulasnella sp. 408]
MTVNAAQGEMPNLTVELTAAAVARKKGGAVTSNSAHASRLRDPSLPARSRTFGKRNKPKPFSTTAPWDREAHSQDNSNTLIPVTPLLDAARDLRHSRHGSQQKYEELTAGLEKELKKQMDSRLIEAAVGLEKSGRQLDRDARLFLAVELAKYRQVFRGEDAADSKESKAFKDRILDALFDTFPDLSPDNRVFKSEAAEVAYREQYDIYFRGRLQLCDKKEKELKGTGVISRRSATLDQVLLAGTKRRKTALSAWLTTLDPKADEWKRMAQKQVVLTERWVKKNPNGNLDDNRLQLERAAKQAVFQEECNKDPTLYDKAKALARNMKIASQTFSAGDKAENSLDGAATLGYIAATVSQHTDLCIALIVVGEFEEGKPNAYMSGHDLTFAENREQFGFPRGQALVDKDPNSAWSKTVDPMISDYISRISPGGCADVHFDDVVPNIEASALDKPLGKQALPDQPEAELTAYDWSGEPSKQRAKAYFETNIRKLRSISNVMWKTITGKPDQYLRGLPDIVFCETGRYDVDVETGEIVPHPMKFTNPDDWSDSEVIIWENHIRKSEAGLLAANQTLAFVDRNGRVHRACSAVGKVPLGESAADFMGSTYVDEAYDDAEDYTHQIAGVQPVDEDDNERDGSDHYQPTLTDEEARNAVIETKTERTAHGNRNTDLPHIQHASVAPAPSATLTTHQANYPRVDPGFASLGSLEKDRHIRRTVEVVPWKGLTPPVQRGPQLSSAIEAILLDECNSFDHVLAEEVNLLERFQRVRQAIANDQLVQLIWTRHADRLFNVEEAPPQMHGSEQYYETSFDAVLGAVLSAIEDGLKELFSSTAFLRLRLGGRNGVILIFRALSMLFPVHSRPSIKNRFLWSAVRLHYFTILALSVRRSFLAAKAFVAQLGVLSPSSSNSTNPLAAAILAWEGALAVRLQTWSNLVVQEDLQPLIEVSSPNIQAESSAGGEIYHSVSTLRWYDVPAPRTPWHISLSIPSSSVADTVEWLQTIIPQDLSICSLCHFGTCIFALMVAARGTSQWEADPLWGNLVNALQHSSLWHFEPQLNSARSDVPDDLDDRRSPEMHDGDRIFGDDHPRSGTPVSPSLSPTPQEISLGHPAVMRDLVQARTPGRDNGHMDEAEATSLLEDLLDDKNFMHEQQISSNGLTAQVGPRLGDFAIAPGDLPLDDTGGAARETPPTNAPPKAQEKAVEPAAPFEQVPEARKVRSSNSTAKAKRKSIEASDAEDGNEAGPSASKRPRTRSAQKAKVSTEDESKSGSEAGPSAPKRPRTRAETAKAPSEDEAPNEKDPGASKGRRSNPKAVSKPKVANGKR